MTAPTLAELRRQRDLVTEADLVELRLDSVDDPDVAAALEGRTKPVILTCRAAWEGGGFAGSEDERRALLRQALDLGAEYVDVEWRAGFDDLIRLGGPRIVLSSHDFAGMPADLAAQAAAMRATGAGVVKIAVKPLRLSDSLTLLELAKTFGPDERKVLIAMGDLGLPTRVLAGRFGSAWTYAGMVRDVGQITASLLLQQYRFRSIDAGTAVYGLAGSPIGHSVSPAMHNAAFAAAGINAVYLPLPAVDADDFVNFARGIGLKGASVTIPYKVALFDRVDDVDDLAKRVGALNTIKMDAQGWHARNTDVAGFLQPLRERSVPMAGRRASILGAGGSARAVALALAGEGMHVTVHARDEQKAHHRGVGGERCRWRVPAGDRLVGRACELHACRYAATHRCQPHAGLGLRARPGVRPHLQPRCDASAEGRRHGRVRHGRRPRHAGRAGGRAVRVVDRCASTRERDARGGQ